MTNGNEPAFGFQMIRQDRHGRDMTGRITHLGVSKRELFSAMAMQGACANEVYAPLTAEKMEKSAKGWVAAADALIAALESVGSSLPGEGK